MSERSTPVIVAANVWKSYDRGRIPVLEGVDLAVERGEVVGLWGASGSGKSTLLHLIGALDAPDRGTVHICGRDTAGEAARLELRRRHLGFVFQLHNLIPDLTAEENILVPALGARTPAAEARARAAALLDAVGLAPRRHHRVQDLSGGERQRAAICRALLNRPAVVLADEPTGALDEHTADGVFDLFRDLARREGAAVVIATHARRFADACDRVLRMRDGRLQPL